MAWYLLSLHELVLFYYLKRREPHAIRLTRPAEFLLTAITLLSIFPLLYIGYWFPPRHFEVGHGAICIRTGYNGGRS